MLRIQFLCESLKAADDFPFCSMAGLATFANWLSLLYTARALICFPQMLIPFNIKFWFSQQQPWMRAKGVLSFFFFFRFERLRFSWRRFQLTAWSQQRGLSFRYKSIPHSSPSYWRQAKRRKKLEWVDGGFLKCHTLICQWCVLIPSGDAIDGAEGLKSTVEPAA